MKIVRIFDQCLFAFKFGENSNEFMRLFDYWSDIEQLEEFFENNKEDLNRSIWGYISVADAIIRTVEDAQRLEDKLRKLSLQIETTHEGLETLFKPLDDRQSQIDHLLNKSKAKQSWLRIYALRIEKNVYVITGGAIKLTHEMKDRNHTKEELLKIERCRNYLIQEGLIDKEGITEAVEIS